MVIAKKITAVLLEKQIIAENDREVQEYGLELVIADLVNFFIVFMTGGLLHKFGETILYLLCFSTTRCFCGGFHANTHRSCSVAMFLSFLGFVGVEQMVQNSTGWIVGTGTVLAWIPLLLFAPVPHKNRPMTNRLRRMNRQRSILSYALWSGVGCGLYIAGKDEAFTVLVSLWGGVGKYCVGSGYAV